MSDFWRLLGYVRPYWARLAASVVLMAVVGFCHAMMALLVGPIFDRVLNPASPETPVALFRLPGFERTIYLQDFLPAAVHNVWTMVAISILAVFLAKGVCDFFGNYLVNYVGFAAVTDLRNHVYSSVLRQSTAFFRRERTGRLMSSILNDVDKIQVGASHILADFLRQSCVLLGLLFVVLRTDWVLAAVSLTLLPFVLVPTARIGRRIRSISRSAQDSVAEMNQILEETITGHSIVKAFGMEAFEIRRFSQSAARMFRRNLRYVRQQALASPIIEMFGALTIVGLLTYARTQIKADRMTAGQFTSFVIALLMMYEPVKRLNGIHNIFQQALGASQRVFEYLVHEQEVKERPGAPALKPFSRSIEFDHVSFRYPDSKNGLVLDGIDLCVNAGEVVAIVGTSGAGKTTLVSLLPRFFDPTAGSIRIDGQDIGEVSIRSLREQIGLVTQETFLFDDTAANNISYGRPDLPRAAIEAAAWAALAADFIAELPQGYDTIIGERGQRLSGGQRQRIAIARAILKNAPILILDEATSHLDTESEVLVQRALANLMEGRTVIVIAHRLSTIRRADKIVVIEGGRIAEIGRHETLLQNGGLYRRLHELQFQA
ncbi:MAG: ATP-binding cassette domain-containing protein [Acidobacteria bacterium]|nr:ATP-binding cassette domain-containing protein [Acidobacteriota bacterium]